VTNWLGQTFLTKLFEPKTIKFLVTSSSFCKTKTRRSTHTNYLAKLLKSVPSFSAGRPASYRHPIPCQHLYCRLLTSRNDLKPLCNLQQIHSKSAALSAIPCASQRAMSPKKLRIIRTEFPGARESYTIH
jgi:hypothetical protein